MTFFVTVETSHYRCIPVLRPRTTRSQPLVVRCLRSVAAAVVLLSGLRAWTVPGPVSVLSAPRALLDCRNRPASSMCLGCLSITATRASSGSISRNYSLMMRSSSSSLDLLSLAQRMARSFTRVMSSWGDSPSLGHNFQNLSRYVSSLMSYHLRMASLTLW